MKYLVLLSFFVSFSPLHALPSDLAEFHQASNAFTELVAKEKANGSMPRIADPEVAKVISVISNHEKFVDQADYSVTEIGALMDVCEKSNGHNFAYALAGIDTLAKTGNPETDNQNLVALATKNVNTYYPELTLIQPFGVFCLAKATPLLEEFIKGLKPEELTDVRKQGVTQMKNGIVQTITGILQATLDNSEPEKFKTYQAALLDSLVATIKPFSRIMDVAKRQQLIALLEAATPERKAGNEEKFQQIITGLQDTNCEGLCAVN